MSITFHVPDSTPAGIGGIDEYTVLMMHGDENPFEDSSSQGHVPSGGTRSAVESKFGGYSIASKVSIPDSDDWYFGTGEFTIDFWAKWNTVPTSAWKEFFSQLTVDGTSNSCMTMGSATTIGYLLSFTYLPNGSAPVPVHTSGFTWDTNWTHLAVVRDNLAGLIRVFVNGTQRGSGVISGATSFYNSSKNLTIGGRNDTAVYDIDGYLDELRISKGIARWTTDFDPPTGPYTI